MRRTLDRRCADTARSVVGCARWPSDRGPYAERRGEHLGSSRSRSRRRRAQARLPKSVYGALIAGTEQGLSMDDNLAAFAELGVRPITAGQSPTREMATEVMGQPMSMPVIISPTGVQAVHPDGEVAVARAAAARGVVMGLSSFASKPLEEVVAANPQTFFQIYWAGDRDSMVARMDRAKAAGAVGLILTLDWSFVHSRDWGSPDIPQDMSWRTMVKHAPEAIMRPAWLVEWLRTGSIPQLGRPQLPDRWGARARLLRGLRHLDGHAATDVGRRRVARASSGAARSWSRASAAPIEARRAVDAGATAISVSNHGGNNLDGTPAPIRVLPEIVDAVGDQIEIVMDGGDPARQRRRQGPRARGQGRDDRSRLPVGSRRQRSGRASRTSSTCCAWASTRTCSAWASRRSPSCRPDDLVIPPTSARRTWADRVADGPADRRKFTSMSPSRRLGRQLAPGTLVTCRRPLVDARRVPLEGAHNVRDLGGYPSRFGGSVRWGRLYRADRLDALTASTTSRRSPASG